jgi:hypothetical protein
MLRKYDYTNSMMKVFSIDGNGDTLTECPNNLVEPNSNCKGELWESLMVIFFNPLLLASLIIFSKSFIELILWILLPEKLDPELDFEPELELNLKLILTLLY